MFDIEKELAKINVPYLGQDLISAKLIQNIRQDDQVIELNVKFSFPNNHLKQYLESEIAKTLASSQKQIKIHFQTTIDTHVGNKALKALPNIKNIIPVASGKGGVGKSTVAVNIALALAKEGARVGLLDADIHGPSQPKMLGVEEAKPQVKDKKIYPIIAHGIQTMSIGFLVDMNAAMIWRGPMISMALQQLLNDTQWDNLDYLVVDLPPGTGDIQLTLSQKVPVSAAVIVTTPQDLALLDARRAVEMFKKVNVPVLGIIENMSLHQCSQCGTIEHIFGKEGASNLAIQCGTEMLGALPLDIQIREQTDLGMPIIVSNPDSSIAKLYTDIALTIAAKLSLQPKDYSNKFPNIAITES